MATRTSNCSLDEEFVRVEHVAGDGEVDLVTYEPAVARTAMLAVYRAIEARGITRGWLRLGLGFATGLIVSHVAPALIDIA